MVRTGTETVVSRWNGRGIELTLFLASRLLQDFDLIIATLVRLSIDTAAVGDLKPKLFILTVEFLQGVRREGGPCLDGVRRIVVIKW